MPLWPPDTPPSIDDALELVRDVLGMDAAYLSRVGADEQEVVRLVGDGERAGVHEGMLVPLQDTYCDRMLNGRVDNVVRDATCEAELAGVRGPAAYIGVPLELRNGELLGTLRAASGEPHAELSERDVRFMRVLAGVLAAELERAELRDRFTELDRLEDDRARALQLYREVHNELVLARYAFDRRDDRATSRHLARATERVAETIDRMLPDELPPGRLRKPDDAPQ